MLNKTFIGLSCVAAAIFAHAEDAAEDAAESHVIVATGDIFDDIVKSSEYTLMEFYAPWCGHCKKLAPEYDQAAEELKDDDRFQLAKMDCTEADNKDKCSEFDVKGYPTLKVFTKDSDKPFAYEQGRNADAMVKFLKKQVDPVVVEISSEEDFNEFKKKDLAIAGVVSGEEKELFIKVANKLKNDHEYSWAIVDESLQTDKVVMFHEHDAGKSVMNVDLTDGSLEEFAFNSSFPIVGEIGPENYKNYMSRGLPICWFFVDPAEEETAIAAFKEAAADSDLVGKLSFVKLDGVKWVQHAKSMGVTDSPGIAISTDGNKNYVFDKDSNSVADIKGFASDMLDGTSKPHLKSQEIPEQSPDSSVVTLVGKNFEQEVFESGKDVFVEFYAPWCGHCKNLTPKWELLAEEFAHAEDVVIAKIDATENDTPAQISGFPTLIFYKAGSKEGIKYEGEREVEALVKNVQANASKEIPEKPSHDEL